MMLASRAAFVAPSSSRSSGRRSVVTRAGAINPSVKKDVDKVVDTVTPKDLGGKPQAAYCRCWRSATFPLCNGAHVAHNKETGDNVGPLLVKASD